MKKIGNFFENSYKNIGKQKSENNEINSKNLCKNSKIFEKNRKQLPKIYVIIGKIFEKIY